MGEDIKWDEKKNKYIYIYILIGGGLGNESNIDVLLGSSARPVPIFASIGNEDFVAKFVLKNRRF